MLTRKQHELIRFIQARLEETGVSPSFEEMKEALDLRSKSGVHRLISALEERGFIRRLPNRARALEVLRQPEDATSKASTRAAANSNSALTAMRPPAATPPAPANDVIEIPLHGRIAAGVPIEALEGQSMLPVPAALLGSGVDSDNVADFYQAADGFIIGSYFKVDGRWANPVDAERVRKLMTQVFNFSSRLAVDAGSERLSQ